MSLINREELLRRLKLHGRRRDGKMVTPEWMQVAIKEVEHMPISLESSVAYWVVGSDVDDSMPTTPEENGWGIWYECSNCHHVRHDTPGRCPSCMSKMVNGEDLLNPNCISVGAACLASSMVTMVVHRTPEHELIRIHNQTKGHFPE